MGSHRHEDWPNGITMSPQQKKSFDLQPELCGKLLKLRPLRAADYDDLYSVAADKLIWQQHPVKNRYEERVFRAFFEESLASGGALAVIERKSSDIIGSSRFFFYNGEEIEIGWTFLARPYWGGRYNGELKQLMLQHAFEFVDTVILLAGLENIRSQRAIEKIGGKRIEKKADASGHESYLYRITRVKFNARHATGV